MPQRANKLINANAMPTTKQYADSMIINYIKKVI